MVFSESLYFLILFTLPAALHILYHAYIRLAPKGNADKSIELAENIIFCLAVFFVNLVLMRKDMWLLTQYLLAENKNEFCVMNNFDYIHFMAKYFVVNLLTSIGVIGIWYAVLIRIYRRIINLCNRAMHKPEELTFSDTWRNLFETTEIVDINNSVLWIERSGVFITAGLLGAYPAPHVETKEIVLYNTDFIKQLFEEDKGKELKDKVFPFAVAEFYDIEHDMLMKIYSAKGYDKYCEEEEDVAK